MRLGKVSYHTNNITESDTITTTTKTNIALAELAEKGAESDLLKQMIQFVAQRMMGMDAESLCAAAYGERSPERLATERSSGRHAPAQSS